MASNTAWNTQLLRDFQAFSLPFSCKDKCITSQWTDGVEVISC